MSGISKMFYNNCESVGENVSVDRNDSQNSSINLSGVSDLSANIEAYLNNGENIENLNLSEIRSDVDFSVDGSEARPKRVRNKPIYNVEKGSDEDISCSDGSDVSFHVSQNEGEIQLSDEENPYVPQIKKIKN